MKRPSLKGRFGSKESRGDDQTADAIADALTADDTVIEIRPAKRSNGMGLKKLLLMGTGAIGIAYWARNSQRAGDLVGSVKEKTINRTHQAAETLEGKSETASDRIEEGSKRTGEAVQETGEMIAERTEEAGEKAADEIDNDESGSAKP